MSFRKFLNDNKIVIIMRAAPGSGKSYKVRELLTKFGGDENHICSADKYFENLASEDFIKQYGRKPNEEELRAGYRKFWNPKALSAAHGYCFKKFQEAIAQDISPIIIDNTNITKNQFERYFKYAEDNDYKVRFEEPESPWHKEAEDHLGYFNVDNSDKLQKLRDELSKRNTHGVPPEAIERMINSWERIPAGRYLKYDDVFKKA